MEAKHVDKKVEEQKEEDKEEGEWEYYYEDLEAGPAGKNNPAEAAVAAAAALPVSCRRVRSKAAARLRLPSSTRTRPT